MQNISHVAGADELGEGEKDGELREELSPSQNAARRASFVSELRSSPPSLPRILSNDGARSFYRCEDCLFLIKEV